MPLPLGPSAHADLVLHHEIVGKAARGSPPLVMIHGFGANNYTWRHLVPALGASHRMVMVELKGFGRSPKPEDGAYSIIDQAALVHDFLQRLGLEAITLVGHSLGGGVALALALRLRDEGAIRLDRLVLIDAVSYAQRLPAFIRLLRVPGIGELGSCIVPVRLQVRGVLAQSYHDPGKITRESVDAYATPIGMPGGRAAILATARQIVPPDIERWTARFPTIDARTLVLWGDDDRIVPVMHGHRLARDLPHASFRLIERCGHIPQEEQPQATLGALEPFLA